MRLFIGEPVWTALNRPQEGHPARQEYVKNVMGNTGFALAAHWTCRCRSFSEIQTYNFLNSFTSRHIWTKSRMRKHCCVVMEHHAALACTRRRYCICILWERTMYQYFPLCLLDTDTLGCTWLQQQLPTMLYLCILLAQCPCIAMGNINFTRIYMRLLEGRAWCSGRAYRL